METYVCVEERFRPESSEDRQLEEVRTGKS